MEFEQTAIKTKKVAVEGQVGLLVAGLLVVAMFGDQAISQTVMNPASWFGNLFQVIGLVFSPTLLFLSAWVIFFWVKQVQVHHFIKWPLLMGVVSFAGYQVWQGVTITLFMLVASLAGPTSAEALKTQTLETTLRTVEIPPWYVPVMIALVLILIVGGSFFCIRWLTKQSPASLNRLILVALGAMVVVYASNECSNLLKNVWGRYRPVELAAENWQHFTPWYQINGQNMHQSFPSGHSAQGWMALYLPLFIAPEQMKKRRSWFYFGVLFGSCVALSRVLIGAHFLSDVTIGSLITIILVYVVTRFLNVTFTGEPLIK